MSLEGDIAVTKRAIAGCDGPVVLVADYHGGVVVTEAGTALVDIAGSFQTRANP